MWIVTARIPLSTGGWPGRANENSLLLIKPWRTRLRHELVCNQLKLVRSALLSLLMALLMMISLGRQQLRELGLRSFDEEAS